jgi:hypothetical protein
LNTSPLAEAIARIFETDFPVRRNEPSLNDYCGDLRRLAALGKHVRYHEDMPWFAAFHLDATDQLDAGSAFAVFLVGLVSRGACA